MRRVVVVGGGMGGLAAARELHKLGRVAVTLIDRKEYFEVTYAQLRGLVDPDLGEASRTAYRTAFRGTFVQGEVTAVEEGAVRLASGQRVEFDALILAPGSHYPRLPLLKADGLTTLAQRTEAGRVAHERFLAATGYLVVGGGVVGVELAGELASAAPGKRVRLTHKGSRLVENLTPKASALALRHLQALGVEVLFETSEAKADEGEEAYPTVSPTLGTGFLADSGVLDERGRIRVDGFLRVQGKPGWYALGDAAASGEAPHGASARRQAEYLAKALSGEAGAPGKPYAARPPIALVPIGRTQGFLQAPFGLITWKFAVDLKRKDFFTSRFRKDFSEA